MHTGLPGFNNLHYNVACMATRQNALKAPPLPARVGSPANAVKFSVNISAEVGTELKRIAFENRVSESSVIEIALRQLFGRVSKERLGVFLRQNGACLRRRS
ncbi:MAG TPA: hypothetical protein VFE17_06580 [Candidatus Baltobacteraceae bacterium]|jgi:hypothetical protein|nr:hypothetical protein [Candidatus Baltobacteraceae bacterium]